MVNREQPTVDRRTVLGSVGTGTVGYLLPPGVVDQIDDRSSSTFNVVAINETSKGKFGYPVESGIEAVRVRPSSSVDADTISGTLDSTIATDSVGLSRQPDGTYLDDTISIPAFTQFVTLELPAVGDEVDVPITYAKDPLAAPVPDWISWPASSTRVGVEGQEYYGINMDDVSTYNSSPTRHAWLTFATDNTLVEDPATRHKVGLTSYVALEDRQGGWVFTPEALNEWSDRLIKIRDTANTADDILFIRDTAAEMLGEFLSFAVSGGTSKGATEVAEEFTGQLAKQFAQEYVEDYLQKWVQENLGFAEASEEALREMANDKLTRSADLAESTIPTLNRFGRNDVWTHDSARIVWENVRESIVQGSLAMVLRENLLPSADLRSQFADVASKVASGATGLPVSMLVDRIMSGDLGYITKAMRETSWIRLEFEELAKSFGEHSDSVHESILSLYGDRALFEPVRAPTIFNRLEITGTGQSAEYRFTVGNVLLGDPDTGVLEDDDQIENSSAHGFVSGDDVDHYLFSGELLDFEFVEGTANVKVNGRPYEDLYQTLEVVATTKGERLTYEFTVEGDVNRTRTSDRIAAGDNDSITTNEDGTVTVRGVTGNTYGDAYRLRGDVTSFQKTGGDSAVEIRLDGTDVTDQYVDDTSADADSQVLEVHSFEGGPKFTYEFVVDGGVTPVRGKDRVSADKNDGRKERDDGTVTVNGITGNGYGDAFRLHGQLNHLRVYANADDFRVVLDGEELGAEEYSYDGAKLFQVVSVEDGPKFSYQFTVDGEIGAVELVGDGSADRNDSVRERDDGTFTVAGVVGNGYGDSYWVRGDFESLSVDADRDDYRLNLAGTVVNAEDLV